MMKEGKNGSNMLHKDLGNIQQLQIRLTKFLQHLRGKLLQEARGFFLVSPQFQ